MKLTTVIGSVNNNPKYYMFIPEQILFWKKFGINFIAVFVGTHLPDELLEHKNNIVMWQHNSDLNPAYVGQNIRMYYAARIDLPDDEMVMLTDMDMLPTNPTYYTSGLEQHKFEDFIYYRQVDGDQIYMCYNAAHPKIWGKVFNIRDDADVRTRLEENYNSNYDGIPGSTGWYIDQVVMYKNLIHYDHLKVLNRPLKRLEPYTYRNHLQKNDTNFLRQYDDVHFHRSYHDNADLIMDAEHQLHAYFSQKKILDEINSFQNIWHGGFRTGYNTKRNQKEIEEYLKNNMRGKTCLEIGCGGGQWSRFIYDLDIFDEIYCIDVLSAEHNNFWEYVGDEKKDKIKYVQVTDFNLDFIPSDFLDYVFSYDVFCHISYSVQEKYLENLYKKCKVNCKLFIMYADANKYFESEPENIFIQETAQREKGAIFSNNEELIKVLIDDCDSESSPGRWYWIGIEKFINLLIKYNYKILEIDLDIDKTNPITLFEK